MVGRTDSTDFPTVNPFQAANNGGASDAFIAKLSPDGSDLVYASYFGGSGLDTGSSVAVDPFGNAYLTGFTSSTDLFTTGGAFQTTYGGGEYDTYVVKVNDTGSGLIYATYLGGTDSEGLNLNSTSEFIFLPNMTVDASGNAYVTGQTSSTDFPTTGSAFQTTYGGGGQ